MIDPDRSRSICKRSSPRSIKLVCAPIDRRDIVDRSRSTIIKRERALFLSLFMNTVEFSLSLQVGKHSLMMTSYGDVVLSGEREVADLPFNGCFLKEAVNKKPERGS